MIIPATAVLTNPLRDAVQPQPAKNAGPAREAALVSRAQEKPEVKPEVAPAQARAALTEINQTLRMASIGVQFEFDQEADILIAKVVDVASGEVIRQMPSEEMVRISKALGKLQGLLLRQTA